VRAKYIGRDVCIPKEIEGEYIPVDDGKLGERMGHFTINGQKHIVTRDNLTFIDEDTMKTTKTIQTIILNKFKTDFKHYFPDIPYEEVAFISHIDVINFQTPINPESFDKYIKNVVMLQQNETVMNYIVTKYGQTAACWLNARHTEMPEYKGLSLETFNKPVKSNNQIIPVTQLLQINNGAITFNKTDAISFIDNNFSGINELEESEQLTKVKIVKDWIKELDTHRITLTKPIQEALKQLKADVDYAITYAETQFADIAKRQAEVKAKAKADKRAEIEVLIHAAIEKHGLNQVHGTMLSILEDYYLAKWKIKAIADDINKRAETLFQAQDSVRIAKELENVKIESRTRLLQQLNNKYNMTVAYSLMPIDKFTDEQVENAFINFDLKNKEVKQVAENVYPKTATPVIPETVPTTNITAPENFCVKLMISCKDETKLNTFIKMIQAQSVKGYDVKIMQ
jgi:hypothetical protein